MNFSFVNPAALWALPLALLPVLLHLLLRRPPKKVPFGDLRFLMKVLERARPRRRIFEWLVLLLRVLAVLCLALFLSRPVMHWGGGAGTSDAVSLVILLDHSYSMQSQESGISQWEKMAQYAEKTLSSLRETDRSALVLFSDQIDSFSGPLTNQHRKLISDLSEMKPGFHATNLLPALQLAYQTLSNSGSANKFILILSDMARHGWLAGGPADPEARVQDWSGSIKNFDPQVKIIFPEAKAPKENNAIQSVDFLADLRSGSSKLQLELRNWNGSGERECLVALEYPGQNKSFETSAALSANERKTFFLQSAAPEGPSSGILRLRPDRLPLDGEFYFTQNPAQRIRVLCVEERSGVAALSGESYFLRQALISPPSPFEIVTVTQAELKKVPLDVYQTLLLINPSELDEDTARHLEQFVRKGGSVFVTLGERSVSHKLDAISSLLPFSVQELKETSVLRVKGESDLQKQMSLDEYDLSKIEVRKIVRCFLKENGDPWIVLSDGSPLLAFSRDGKIAVWTTSIDRSWNNFASKPLYVPLMRSIVQKLSSRGSESRKLYYRVGEVFRKDWPQQRKQRYELMSPDRKLLPLHETLGGVYSDLLEIPGIYQLSSASGGEPEKFAVNVETRFHEGDGTLLSDGERKSVLPGTPFVSVKTGSSFSGDLLAALRGKELNRLLLVLAGLFLLGEILLTRRKT